MLGQKPPPNLFSRSGKPDHGILTKYWTASGWVQRVGGLVIGLSYLMGGGALVFSSFHIRSELRSIFHNQIAANVFGIAIGVIVAIVGAFVLLLAARLLRGSVRPGSR